MPNRYQNIPVVKGSNEKRVVKFIIYPPIPRTVEDIYIITNPGDRLDLLAYKYYENVNYWWILAEANALGKGTLSIPPGTQLRIPANYLTLASNYEQLNK